MKEIKLNKGLTTQVDDEDYEYLNQFKWHVRKDCNTYYAVRQRKEKPHRLILMHRVIMNTPDGLQVDHKDHNGLNNQKLNLRNCTCSQNQMNLSSRRSATGYLGVYYCGGQIVAQIKTDGKVKHLGIFKTIEEAAKVRDKASLQYFGEFANLNFKN